MVQIYIIFLVKICTKMKTEGKKMV